MLSHCLNTKYILTTTAKYIALLSVHSCFVQMPPTFRRWLVLGFHHNSSVYTAVLRRLLQSLAVYTKTLACITLLEIQSITL